MGAGEFDPFLVFTKIDCVTFAENRSQLWYACFTAHGREMTMGDGKAKLSKLDVIPANGRIEKLPCNP